MRRGSPNGSTPDGQHAGGGVSGLDLDHLADSESESGSESKTSAVRSAPAKNIAERDLVRKGERIQYQFNIAAVHEEPEYEWFGGKVSSAVAPGWYKVAFDDGEVLDMKFNKDNGPGSGDDHQVWRREKDTQPKNPPHRSRQATPEKTDDRTGGLSDPVSDSPSSDTEESAEESEEDSASSGDSAPLYSRKRKAVDSYDPVAEASRPQFKASHGGTVGQRKRHRNARNDRTQFASEMSLTEKEWLMSLRAGSLLQAWDRKSGTWYDAKVVGVANEEADSSMQIHFVGWKSAHDFWTKRLPTVLRRHGDTGSRSHSRHSQNAGQVPGNGDSDDSSDEDEDQDEDEDEGELIDLSDRNAIKALESGLRRRPAVNYTESTKPLPACASQTLTRTESGSAAWTEDELHKLKGLVQRYGPSDWKEKAREFDRRTAKSLQSQYHKHKDEWEGAGLVVSPRASSRNAQSDSAMRGIANPEIAALLASQGVTTLSQLASLDQDLVPTFATVGSVPENDIARAIQAAQQALKSSSGADDEDFHSIDDDDDTPLRFRKSVEETALSKTRKISAAATASTSRKTAAEEEFSGARKIVSIDESVAPEIQPSSEGRGARRKARVNYSDNMSDRAWLKSMESRDDGSFSGPSLQAEKPACQIPQLQLPHTTEIFEIPAQMRQARTHKNSAAERGADLEGKSVSLYSAPEQQWRDANVVRWRPTDGKHGVLYTGSEDEKDVEWLNLDKQAYRVLSDFDEDGGYAISSRQLFGLYNAQYSNLQTAAPTLPSAGGMIFSTLEPDLANVEHEVEEVLGTRTFQGNRECYVKWKNFSYLRAEWVLEERVKFEGKNGAKKIERRVGLETASHIMPWRTVAARDADRRPDAANSDCFTVERILHHREIPDSSSSHEAAADINGPTAETDVNEAIVAASSPNQNGEGAVANQNEEKPFGHTDAPRLPTYEYLVKWRGLNYYECAMSAMESANAIKDDAAINKYHLDRVKYSDSKPYLNR
eukprot:COSAG02_NODE_1408_length_12764_cov_254.164627_2_plen_997_part_00